MQGSGTLEMAFYVILVFTFSNYSFIKISDSEFQKIEHNWNKKIIGKINL